MPVRDEAEGLRAAVSGVLGQAYPGETEVILAVGPSRDGTAALAVALAGEDPRVRVVDNPAGSTPAGLNTAIRAARGTVVARVDGHAEPLPGYLRRAVEVLRETGAVNVGGVQQAEGTTPFERAVAAAMTSRFGAGDAKFHYGGEPGPTDTVYLGVFRTAALRAAGLFDETLERNQDYELNVRLRAAGGTVWFDPDLRVRYRPRGSLRGLARQYWEYGRWKRQVLRRHPGSLRWRQAVPPVALVGVVAGLLLGCRHGTRWGLLAPAAYGAGVVTATTLAGRGLPLAERRLLPAVFPTMHGAWGAGFLAGPPRPRDTCAGSRPRSAVNPPPQGLTRSPPLPRKQEYG